MSSCNHDCSSCSEECSSRDPKSLLIKPNKNTTIKRTIAIVSGKGGVGKSLVTSLLGVNSLKQGKKVAIMDADITGPSIPQCFGVHERLEGDGESIFPATSAHGTKIVSMNLLLEKENDPIIWRGPIIANMVKQFYSDVDYGDVDYLYIDMPPGTGDVPLTVFQSIPVDGIVIVLTPQDLVGMIVEKAVNMAKMMNIPILGIIENMSYVKCNECGSDIYVFGKGHSEEICKTYGLKLLGKIPLDPTIATLCDKGLIEEIENTYLPNDLFN